MCIWFCLSHIHWLSLIHPSSSSRDRVLSSTQFSEIDLDHPTAHHPAHSRQASCAWTTLGKPSGAVQIRICLETMQNTWRNHKISQNSDVGPSLPSAPRIYTQKRTCCHRASRTLHCAKRHGHHPTFRRSTSWWDPVFQVVLLSHLATNVNCLSLARLATHSLWSGFRPECFSPFPSISPRSPTSLQATRRTWHKQKRRMTREERIWLYLLKLGPHASCQILAPTDKNVIDHDKSLCKMLRHP